MSRHQHEWEARARARACACGAMQMRTPSGRWRNVTRQERQMLAFLMAGLFVQRFCDLLLGEKAA